MAGIHTKDGAVLATARQTRSLTALPRVEITECIVETFGNGTIIRFFHQ